MIINLIGKAVESGARLKKAATIIGISARTIIRWQQQSGGQDQRKGSSKAPTNKLNEKERQQVLDISNSAPFRDLSPKQIVPKLADQGVYLASESTFYRVLKEHKMLAHRQASKPAASHHPKQHVATGPCQVWSWDITYLKTSVKGLFFSSLHDRRCLEPQNHRRPGVCRSTHRPQRDAVGPCLHDPRCAA